MRPRLLGIALVSIGLATAGAAGELWLRPRAVPAPEVPLRDTRPAWLLPSQVDAVLTQVGPGIPAEIRSRLSAALVQEGARSGYDPLFLLALVGVESRYRLSAESERGARGLVQLKPSTFAWISAREPDAGGEDLESGDDPVVDVRLACRYFSWLERRFQSRDSALIAYNAGPRNASRAIHGGDVPERWRAYPQLVRREYERLLRVSVGGSDTHTGQLLAKVP
jgi:soluble lytic murein transglycosylase